MSQLTDLLEKVKDDKLTLEQCEKYRDEMIHLHTLMQIEMADLEKKEAIFYDQKAQKEPDITGIALKRAWKASEEGQRLILLNRYLRAVVKETDSLKSRIYGHLRLL